ncbi:hypothetical protein Ciccas_010937, partial [Cichlidogyrus casuarinus]
PRVTDYARRNELNISLDDPDVCFDRFGNLKIRSKSHESRNYRPQDAGSLRKKFTRRDSCSPRPIG